MPPDVVAIVRPPAVATVKFNIQPADAIVEIAGKEVGHSSPFETELEPGVYWVSVHRDGYISFSLKVALRSAEPQTVNLALERVPESPPMAAAVAVAEMADGGKVKPARRVRKSRPKTPREDAPPAVELAAAAPCNKAGFAAVYNTADPAPAAVLDALRTLRRCREAGAVSDAEFERIQAALVARL